MARIETIPIFFFVAILSLGMLDPAAAGPIEPPPWTWRKGSFGLSASSEYFWSRANYGPARGEFTRLTGDNNLTDFRNWVKGRYAWWPRFSTYAGAGLTQSRVVDTYNEKTNTGLSEFFAGGNFVIWREWLRMIAEVEVGAPFAPVSRYQTAPLLSDGSIYTRALLHWRKDIKRVKFFGHVGAQIPFDGLAKTLPYGAFVEVPLGNILIGGGIDGVETLLNDELTLAERSITLGTADGGSYRYRTFDPALLRARGWVGFRPGNTTEIRAGYDKTLTGLRTAEGQALTISVSFSSAPRKGKQGQNAIDSDAISAPGTTDSFKLDSEEVDPDVIAPQNDFVPGTSGSDLNETERLLNGK